ncbi:MAG TPA: thioredoxin [Nitrospiraceae bacterium]|nr:thioredoxin [Nitrospiraceae bacterium]
MAGEVTNVTANTWDKEVTQHKGLIMVDFWATWCGPCRVVAPVVEELAKEYVGRAKFVKVNTDESPDLAGQYRVMGIPTLMFFKDGKQVDQIVGAVPKGQLKTKLDSLLS